MFLAIDLGNTTCAMAVMSGPRVIKIYEADSRVPRSEFCEQFTKNVRAVRRDYKNISKVIICSVVPPLTKHLIVIVKSQLHLTVDVVGQSVGVPIENKYQNPKQVGMDRLVCAYAAKQFYGTPAIIIDLGTAITFDVISKNGDYQGGLIVPGIQMSADSLFQKTALLPRVSRIEIPKKLIGKTTEESILSGIFYGYGNMCVGLIKEISLQLKGRPHVIVTGGFTQMMKRHLKSVSHKVDENLVFKGLALISLAK